MSNNCAALPRKKAESVSYPRTAADLEFFIRELAQTPGAEIFMDELIRLAETVHVKTFGFDEKKAEEQILIALYAHDCLEIDNLCELLKMPEKFVLPLVERLVSEGIIKVEKRRRWQEPGKHYNAIYYLMD